MESIHDLFQKVREHPDYVFGTVFVKEDFPVMGNPSDLKYVEESLVAAGFEAAEEMGFIPRYPKEN